MKTRTMLMTSLMAFGILAGENAEDYASRLNELGARVENASEGDMAIHAEVIQGAQELLGAQHFNCENAIQILQPQQMTGDCLLVIRGNDEFALDTYFDEIAPGKENSSTRASMKAILQEMDKIQLYVIGYRDDLEDHEVSNWYLLTEFEGQAILLSHERVYT